MTIKEIAKLAGVSSAAVSRYLNGGYVSDEKKEQIKKVIDETGYQPSAQARMLRTKKACLIGVVVPKINSESISRITAGIEKVLSERNYQMLLAGTDNTPAKEIEYMRLFENYPVDGIILVGTMITAEHRRFLKESKVPVVVIGQHTKYANCIYHDDYGAGEAMGCAVAAKSRKEIAYIGVSREDKAAGAAREDGFREGLKRSGKELKDGDVLIGMASSGVHSNGFSLVRKVFDMKEEALKREYDSLGCSLGEALLAPTKIYVKALRTIKESGVKIKACSHITGGGFYENIPRMLCDGMHAVVKKDSYPIPPIFKMLAVDGDIEETMMYNTFNMGLGMILAVDKENVDKTLEAIKAAGEDGYVVGHIEAGDKGVTLC